MSAGRLASTFLQVKLVALTGGIGSGKSSVSDRLRANGAVIVDADEVVKDLQSPGRPIFLEMVARWGDRIVASDGTLDRAAVAGIVFGDDGDAELKALNKMVHPAVRAEMHDQADALSKTDEIVVFDIPLLAEGGGDDRRGASAVIVVDLPVEQAIDRLIELRGFERADVEARIAAQATREERLAMADYVIDNSGDLDALDAEVARCWAWLASLEPTPWPPDIPDPRRHRVDR
jgi:dephospho-CoA kinase